MQCPVGYAEVDAYSVLHGTYNNRRSLIRSCVTNGCIIRAHSPFNGPSMVQRSDVLGHGIARFFTKHVESVRSTPQSGALERRRSALDGLSLRYSGAPSPRGDTSAHTPGNYFGPLSLIRRAFEMTSSLPRVSMLHIRLHNSLEPLEDEHQEDSRRTIIENRRVRNQEAHGQFEKSLPPSTIRVV